MPIARLEETLQVPQEYVWDWLADFAALEKLHPPGNLTEFTCEGSFLGARRYARFNSDLGISEKVIERLDVVCKPHVLAYSLIETNPLPMSDYVAVVNFKKDSENSTTIVWEGHYTQGDLSTEEMSDTLCQFYSLFLDGINRAYESGLRPGESPY
jgi:hypothetical protein